jgi:methylglyoxal synthase
MVALVAHDNKKALMLAFAIRYKCVLEKIPQLCATGTTGSKLIKEVGLTNVRCFASGPLGGDQEIGAAIVRGEIEAIIFMRDPLSAHPHEPDVAALGRLADVHNIPLASCLASAEIMIEHLAKKIGIDLEAERKVGDPSSPASPQQHPNQDLRLLHEQHSQQFAAATESFA